MTEAELLYGKAGYLYCLLIIKQYKPSSSVVDRAIKNVTIEIIQNGLRFDDEDNLIKDSVLEYTFPTGKGKKYIGAAHGYIGILYMILKAFEFIPIQEIPNVYHKIVKSTCLYILNMQSEDANFPLIENNFSKHLVHFCHGASGAIPFLLQCYEYYMEERFLVAAEKAGELVFTKGIIRKGNSLCHGIPGNVYPLFALYKVTGDPKWRTKGYCLANATYIKRIQIECAKYRDPTRKVIGTPDTVYSLMEGRMGLVVMYMDLMTDELNMNFPGYQV